MLEQVFPFERAVAVFDRMITDAEAGNHDARVLLLAYAYGKPTERHELTGAEGTSLFPEFERALERAYADTPDNDPPAD